MPASTFKRLVLCLDGTWNSASSDEPLTNIVRIRNLIDPKCVKENSDEVEDQRIYYDDGVGTADDDRISGGAFGRGLDRNVRQAYRFLSQFYDPGIEIYIFGFSRGAFTARSLVGYVGAAGLLRRHYCSPEIEERCWNHYRTPPEDRFPADKWLLSRYTHESIRITCIGVFDTVGALGVPLDAFRKSNRRKYAFHDTALSSIVDHAFHALAVDEKRGPFQAAIWEMPTHKNNTAVEQVWFPGVHANIGGGYEDAGLSDLTLRWMIDRIKKWCPRLVLDASEARIEGDFCGELYESRTALYTYSKVRPRIRIINQTGRDELKRNRLSCLTRNARPIGERIHWSVLKRWGESHLSGTNLPKYEPANVGAVLKSIYDGAASARLPVVGPSSEPLNWLHDDADFEFLLNIMPTEKHCAGLKTARSCGA